MLETGSNRLSAQILLLIALFAFQVSSAVAGEASVGNRFGIDDYFKILRIKELALSSDGEMVAYAVEYQSLEENRTLRYVHVGGTGAGAKSEPIEAIQDARDLSWIPGTHELAYLSGRDGSTQVYSYDVRSGSVHQHTASKPPVIQYRFSPDGSSLAYITQIAQSQNKKLYHDLQSGDRGILVNGFVGNVYNFIDPGWPDLHNRSRTVLWVVLESKGQRKITVPGYVRQFHWASDSRKISLTYVSKEVPSGYLFNHVTSVGIYDIDENDFRPIFVARATPAEIGGATYYSGGEWLYNEDAFVVRRYIERGVWYRDTAWTVVRYAVSHSTKVQEPLWSSTSDNLEASIFPVSRKRIFINATVRAVQSLHRLTNDGVGERSEIVRDVNGSSSLFSFSRSYDQAAFVNQSLNHPPEIYIWRKGRKARQLSELNIALAQKILPKTKEISWKSIDGSVVHGWFMEPPTGTRKSSSSSLPIITFLMGGPGIVLKDQFAPFFDVWPYPFESYAMHGMGVFIVHYRGKSTFGTHFSQPSKIDGEPIEDIMSGLSYLDQLRIADRHRLAISGHSHGAWLGSLVMARSSMFRAGSFAEGSGNMILIYSLTPDFMNRHIHDQVYGMSLYDDPERYIDLSPELHFRNLDTAVLFEAGARSLSINMLGYPKAARYAGMPTEYVVYPKTGHAITIPRLRREAAERNLDWFRFWLNDEEDDVPTKAEQYQRWRAMRRDQKQRQACESFLSETKRNTEKNQGEVRPYGNSQC